MEQVEIRMLKPDEVEAFVRLRAEALENEPFAFGSSVEDDHGADPGFVRDLLANQSERVVFGAFGPELVGMIGLYRDPHRKAAHKAHIWGMYVQKSFRKSGAGRLLLAAAIGHARKMSGVGQVHLSVTETAEAARYLYERNGFVLWGVEPRSLCQDGQEVAEHHLVMVLE